MANAYTYYTSTGRSIQKANFEGIQNILRQLSSKGKITTDSTFVVEYRMELDNCIKFELCMESHSTNRIWNRDLSPQALVWGVTTKQQKMTLQTLKKIYRQRLAWMSEQDLVHYKLSEPKIYNLTEEPEYFYDHADNMLWNSLMDLKIRVSVNDILKVSKIEDLGKVYHKRSWER